METLLEKIKTLSIEQQIRNLYNLDNKFSFKFSFKFIYD